MLMRVADRPSSSTVVLIFQTVTKLVNFDTKYKQIFQEAGMLHMLLALLKSFHGQFLASKGIPSDADGDRDGGGRGGVRRSTELLPWAGAA